jgi:TonB-dependent SusC/RagA subfamily outer membrane receptor
MQRSAIVLEGLLCFLITLAAVDVQAQTGRITGTVRDAATAIPLPNANLILQGTTLGASTDVEGNYEITEIPASNYTLVVTYVGFRRQELQVQIADGQSIVQHFQLNEDYLGLEEAVVTGSGTRERRVVTSSITKLSAESLQQLSGTSPDALLQGQAAGVTVLKSSGTPGAGVSVRVRGSTSISGSNQPLYVVDGVPVSSDDFSQLGLGNQGLNALSTLDPGDIESIEILKDAAATAIYGTRAANGVVLITTRRGQAGRTRDSNCVIRTGFSWEGYGQSVVIRLVVIIRFAPGFGINRNFVIQRSLIHRRSEI